MKTRLILGACVLAAGCGGSHGKMRADTPILAYQKPDISEITGIDEDETPAEETPAPAAKAEAAPAPAAKVAAPAPAAKAPAVPAPAAKAPATPAPAPKK